MIVDVTLMSDFASRILDTRGMASSAASAFSFSASPVIGSSPVTETPAPKAATASGPVFVSP